MQSQFLTDTQHVEIWLPPDYSENPEQRYRVIYMRGVEEGRFEPAIIVAAWSTADRREEYSPWHGAPQYARFLIEELMPKINSEFRTSTRPEDTFVIGSSMGGLLSYYLVKNHPDVFSACGCVSTHFALSKDSFSSRPGRYDNTPHIVKDIAAGQTVPKNVRFYFDYGTETLDASYERDHAPVKNWLLDQGLIEGKDFKMRRYEGEAHSEVAWLARLGDHLDWLLAPTE